MTRKTRKQGGQPTDEAEPDEQAQAAEAPESIETTASVEEQDPLATAQAELAELHEQLHRIAADFDNFRKRVERDRSRDALRVRGIVTAQFLDVLETATQAADASYPDVDAAVAGLVGIQRQLQVVMQ
ncbi:MAG: nucleotide exchange factor GrpE, partial [Candidatus Thermoplasmatota archaeon]|nr:nucleotide exchange factor GrpE [Candidatus Thermoplasmatota archaeon]